MPPIALCGLRCRVALIIGVILTPLTRAFIAPISLVHPYRIKSQFSALPSSNDFAKVESRNHVFANPRNGLESSAFDRRSSGAKWYCELRYFQGKDIKVNWNSPAAAGNFGSVFYGTVEGTPCVIKCPNLEPFSLTLFDTERVVNIKLMSALGGRSVPWAQMLGEVNVAENIGMPRNVARIGIVWKKENDGSTLEDYLSGGKDLARALNVQERTKSPIRVQLCRKVMGEMLIALIQIQEKGIMHRDIKPANTLVCPADPQLPLKLIDFGSSCDFSDPLKRGLGDATFDPMYAPPEQKISIAAPGKFDVYAVAMTGLRVLIPTFTKGGVTKQLSGGRFQQFAEQEFPRANYDLKAWLERTAADDAPGGRQLAEECRAVLALAQSQEDAALLATLVAMLQRSPFSRADAQQAVRMLGAELAGKAQAQVRETKAAETAFIRRLSAQAQVAAKEASAEEEKGRRLEEEEQRRRGKAEEQARKASQEEKRRLQLQLPQKPAAPAAAPAVAAGRANAEQKGLFSFLGGDKAAAAGGGTRGLGDKDVALVVPDTWQEGRDYFRSPRFVFNKGEMVVVFRSDKSRRFGKIMQVNGDVYDVLVDRAGGEGQGQYRADRADNIGKISTGRSLAAELQASDLLADRRARSERKQICGKAKAGDAIPSGWREGIDYNFSPTSLFKAGEIVVAARSDGSFRFGVTRAIKEGGLLEVQVDASAVRLYFPNAVGKVCS